MELVELVRAGTGIRASSVGDRRTIGVAGARIIQLEGYACFIRPGILKDRGAGSSSGQLDGSGLRRLSDDRPG